MIHPDVNKKIIKLTPNKKSISLVILSTLTLYSLIKNA